MVGLAAPMMSTNSEEVIGEVIATVDAQRPPFRLTLGSTAYASIKEALAGRLTALEAQKATALSADRDEAGAR